MGNSIVVGRRASLLALLTLFLGFSFFWALRVPIPQLPPGEWSHFNPDEWNHLATISYMATHRDLPPYNRDYYVSNHPPFYHALAAVVYAAARPLVGHDGTVLFLRLISCLLGAATVWLTYRTARYLLPHAAALLAAGIVAGVPTFVSLSAAVTNENLSTLAATGALYMMVAGMRHGFDSRRVLALALWVAVGIGTKITCFGLLPVAVFALWWSARRRRVQTPLLLAQIGRVLGLPLLLTGWWFLYNQITYGDPIRRAAFDRVWGAYEPGFADMSAGTGISAPEFLFMLAREGWSSFWGKFDAARRNLPAGVYPVLLSVQIAAVAGFILRARRGRLRGYRLAAFWAMALFAAYVIAVYFQFNWQYFSPQGRYFFPLLLPTGLMTAAGWTALFPTRLRSAASAALLAALFLLNLYTAVMVATSPLPQRF